MKFQVAPIGLLVVALFCQACSVNAPTSPPGAGAGEQVFKPGENFVRTWEDISPEEENNLGRAVAAQILSLFRESTSGELEEYLNKVGGVVAASSDRPETYAGYSFVLLESDEVNAFSAPGGIVFITRGFLKLLPNEDALAAVLAHEVSHVTLKHGLQAIQPNRFGDSQTIAGQSVGALNCGNVAGLGAAAFSGAVNDVVTSLIEKGYSRNQEYEADQMAATILERRGYSVAGLTRSAFNARRFKSEIGRMVFDSSGAGRSVSKNHSLREKLFVARHSRCRSTKTQIPRRV